MVKQVTFSSSGNNYIVTAKDIFMDNGSAIVFIKEGKHAHPHEQRIKLGEREWERIKPQLTPIDYESYYGRKPLMKGVQLYQIK